MRIDGIQLREGSSVTNMVIASGSAFPNSPNTGELFYRTDGANKGLYVYEGSNSSWNKHFNANDAALALPNATSPGTYKSVTVSDQGIVTSGTNPNTLAGYGIVDAQALDADLTAIAALAGTSGLLKKTAADTWTLDTNTYLTSNQTITLTGGVTGSGTGTFAVAVVTNANLTGPVTSVGNATAIANGAITNAMLANNSLTIGTTNIALGATSTTLAGLTSVTSTQFVGALNGSVGVITPATGSFTIVNATGSIISNSNIAISNGGAIAEMYFNSGITKIESNATGSSIAIVPSNTVVGVFSTSGLAVTGTITGTSFNSITGLSSTLPAALGTATIGVSTTAARSDHVHALQTSVSGSAATLATGRTFSLSTDATGTSASFDGSANVTIPMTLATVNSNVGSFGSATQVASITLDAKGRATAASNVSIAIPTSAVTSGTFADARIATSNVTQHQASLSIAETQITDGTLLARNAGNETISGNWTFSNVVTGVTPSAASHFATKEYVDGLATGLDTKASCRAATTANITLSGTQTIDGVAVIAGNRVLVKDQSTASQNGIYDVAAGAWVRSADADNLPGAEVTAGMYTFISEGTVNADTGWTLATNDTIVLGTTPLTFTQFTGLGQISAGAGLTKTGSVIDIGTASAARIVVNADNIDLATAGTAGTYRSVTTDAYGRVTNGTNPTTLAGYGITDAVTAVSVVTANGVSGSVTSTTTPAITLTLGAITPSSVTATGQITAGSASGFHLDQIGTRSWNITATGGNLNINSGDGSGTINTNTNLTVDGILRCATDLSGRMFSADGSVIKTKLASFDAGWASYTMYEAASSSLSLGAFGAFGSTKDTAAYSYIAAQGQDYSNATLKVTPSRVAITGSLTAAITNYGVVSISRTVDYLNGIKIKTAIEWANNSFWEVHIHGYHYRQSATVDLRICAYEYSTSGGPYNYSASSAGGWAPTITLVNDAGYVSIVLGINKGDGYFLQCSVDLTSQTPPNLTGWTVVDETGTGTNVTYKSDLGYALVNSLGLSVTGGVILTTTDGLGGLSTSGVGQATIFNNPTGTYSTWQHNGSSIGDIGTGNRVFSGGTNTDFALTARSGGRLVLGANGSEKTIIDTSGHVLPFTTSTQNLGSASFRWNDGYFTTLNSSGAASVASLNVNGPSTATGIFQLGNITAATGTAYGILSRGTLTAAVNGDSLNAFASNLGVVATGTLTGLIFNGALINGSSWTKTGTGTILNAYGLNVTAPTIGTNNYAASFSGFVQVTGNLQTNGDTLVTGTATFGSAGTSAAILNSADDFIINIDSDNNQTTKQFIISANRTIATGGAGSLFTVDETGVTTVSAYLNASTSLNVTAGAANSVVQSFVGGGGTNAYLDFAAVSIGGQTANGAWLRWTRDGSQARDLSIHTTDTGGASFKTLTATSTGIQINGHITATGTLTLGNDITFTGLTASTGLAINTKPAKICFLAANTAGRLQTNVLGSTLSLSTYYDDTSVEISAGSTNKNGIYIGGQSATDPQVQRFYIQNVNVATINSVGLSLTGKITTTGGVDKLTTASGAVSVAAATAPTTGQVLTATSATTATWQASSTVAAAGTLTGTTLAANVVNSSLTSLGTLTSPLSVNAVTQDTTTTAVTTTSATVVDSVSSSAFRTAKYIVQVTDSTNSQYHAVEILVIHDGTTVFKTEYGEITTAASLGTFDAAIVTGTLRLSFTAVAATTKSVKVYRAAITA